MADVPVTEKALKAWLDSAPLDRGVGEGLTFVATVASAKHGRASWVLRYRLGGRQKEKVLGRYPDLSLREARALARQDRAAIQQGVDVGAAKQLRKSQLTDDYSVAALCDAWYKRYIQPNYKEPRVVASALRVHVTPLIGRLPVAEVRPTHVDQVLRRIVEKGSLSVANDVLRYLRRIFKFAVKLRWIESSPVYGFDTADAGGQEFPRKRWLQRSEIEALAATMNSHPTFSRENQLSVWLLLALCVRSMELLAAKRSEFDLPNKVWNLGAGRTKTSAEIRIPLADPVVAWIAEAERLAGDSDHPFPARKRGKNASPHVNRSTLRTALRNIKSLPVERFNVHDLRRTARTHLAMMGVDRFVAERALNHKIKDVEGVYNQYDYFDERKKALALWAAMLQTIECGRSWKAEVEPDVLASL